MAKVPFPIDGPPYIVQGSDDPVFRGESNFGNFFYCASGCGKALIDNYAEENYVGVGIKCIGCGEVSWTPGLIPGEVFSANIMSLGAQGAFLVTRTLKIPPCIIVTCHEEIAREIQLTSPREYSGEFDYSDSGIERLSKKYDEISCGKLDLQIKSLRSKEENIKKFPMAWALSYIKKNNSLGRFPPEDDAALIAFVWLQLFNHVLGVWQHHPRFVVVAKGLAVPKSFLHTASQLIATAHFFGQGHRIGLSLENKHGEANPDLYLRRTGSDNVFLEVKAPEALQWGGHGVISVDEIDDAVRKCLKKSSAQINKSHHGILIISSSCMGDSFSDFLHKAIQKSLKSKGRDHKYIAAVVGMSPSSINFRVSGEHTFDNETNYKFTTTLNKYYCGENPVSIV